MTTATSLDHARAISAARRKTAPTCTAQLCGRKGMRTCRRTMIQNGPEAERGVYWCPSCARYTDGSKGFTKDQRAALKSATRETDGTR